jgi:hypothetical protein
MCYTALSESRVLIISTPGHRAGTGRVKMDRTIEGWKDNGAPQRGGDGQVALKVVNHRTLLVGVLYATTIIVVLMIVSRL